MKRMYSMSIIEYNYSIRTNIMATGIYDTLEEAIYAGKKFIREYVYNKIYENIDDSKLDSIPDDVSDEQFEKFIIDKLKNNITYFINISVFSTNRKKFNTTKELIDYFNSNINHVDNNDLYDFLLSLVEYDSRFYDYNGNYQNNMIFSRQLSDNIVYDLKFTEESCKLRQYNFVYKTID